MSNTNLIDEAIHEFPDQVLKTEEINADLVAYFELLIEMELEERRKGKISHENIRSDH